MSHQFLTPAGFFSYIEHYANQENLKLDLQRLRFKFRQTDNKVDVYLRENLIAVYDLNPCGAFLFAVSHLNKSIN